MLLDSWPLLMLMWWWRGVVQHAVDGICLLYLSAAEKDHGTASIWVCGVACASVLKSSDKVITSREGTMEKCSGIRKWLPAFCRRPSLQATAKKHLWTGPHLGFRAMCKRWRGYGICIFENSATRTVWLTLTRGWFMVKSYSWQSERQRTWIDEAIMIEPYFALAFIDD